MLDRSAEFNVIEDVFCCYRDICKRLNLSKDEILSDSWNQSIPKIIDNAVIGFIRTSSATPSKEESRNINQNLSSSPGYSKHESGLSMEEDRNVWEAISDFCKENLNKSILPLNERGQSFQIIEVGSDFIKLGFAKSTLRLDSWRFLSVFNLLKQNKGRFIELGSSKATPRKFTTEYHMKEIEGNMQGLMTSLWVCTILANSFKDMEFIPKPRYALSMKS